MNRLSDNLSALFGTIGIIFGNYEDAMSWLGDALSFQIMISEIVNRCIGRRVTDACRMVQEGVVLVHTFYGISVASLHNIFYQGI